MGPLAPGFVQGMGASVSAVLFATVLSTAFAEPRLPAVPLESPCDGLAGLEAQPGPPAEPVRGGGRPRTADRVEGAGRRASPVSAPGCVLDRPRASADRAMGPGRQTPADRARPEEASAPGGSHRPPERARRQTADRGGDAGAISARLSGRAPDHHSSRRGGGSLAAAPGRGRRSDGSDQGLGRRAHRAVRRRAATRAPRRDDRRGGEGLVLGRPAPAARPAARCLPVGRGDLRSGPLTPETVPPTLLTSRRVDDAPPHRWKPDWLQDLHLVSRCRGPARPELLERRGSRGWQAGCSLPSSRALTRAPGGKPRCAPGGPPRIVRSLAGGRRRLRPRAHRSPPAPIPVPAG